MALAEEGILGKFPKPDELDGGSEWRVLTEEKAEEVVRLMDLERGRWLQLEEEFVPMHELTDFIARRYAGSSDERRQREHLAWSARSEGWRAASESDSAPRAPAGPVQSPGGGGLRAPAGCDYEPVVG